MFGNKRLAKRSIVGTRVSALWPQDGRFYPGIIQSQVSEETITSNAVYVVRFDDGFSHHIKSRGIIGPGFQAVTTATLKRGQKVFLTLNGREVCGTVIRHDRDIDEVTVSVRTPSGEDFDMVRRIEDIRLLESRKSARLVDQPDTDYSKLADLQLNANDPNNKKRIPSHVIDVPAAPLDKNERHRRRHLSEETHDSEHGGDFDDVEMMDENLAAQVLTSLSVSPKSPCMTTGQMYPGMKENIDGHYPYPDSHLSSSVASSGFYSGHSERDDHSPPLPPLSGSAPMGYKPPTPASDDDSSNSSGRLLICEDDEKTLFQCTWRGCSKSTTSRNAIERHIRRDHYDRDSDLELTDNEEDFHYTEVDIASQSINTMTKSFAAMKTSSPHDEHRHKSDEHRHKHRSRHISEECHLTPEMLGGNSGSDGGLNSVSRSLGNNGGTFDHDYQRKISKQLQASSVPSGGLVLNQGQTATLPIAIEDGQIQRSLSWQIHPSSPGSMVSPTPRPNKLTPQERLFQHQAQSPKSSVAPTSFKVTQHRRPRSEVRKCRKVYGMDHRDQWCTQCKWKKACTRFID